MDGAARGGPHLLGARLQVLAGARAVQEDARALNDQVDVLRPRARPAQLPGTWPACSAPRRLPACSAPRQLAGVMTAHEVARDIMPPGMPCTGALASAPLLG